MTDKLIAELRAKSRALPPAASSIADLLTRAADALEPSGDVVERYRHVKRGTLYEVVGIAELQMNFDSLVDGSEMVVYRGEDGKMWAREYEEFHDGRFQALGASHAE